MKRLITKSVLSILLVSLSGGVYGQRESALSETLSIDRLSWLTENWKGPRDRGVLEEIGCHRLLVRLLLEFAQAKNQKQDSLKLFTSEKSTAA